MEKNYRIHTNIINDTVLNVDMRQDFDFLEILSLKLRQVDAYKLHSSNYGVIVGRVLANDAFGIPNAKVSMFVEVDDDESSLIESIYPYSQITSKDKEGRRYNTLPDYSDDECYRVVGTFPNKRLVLDDDTQLEVFDKYWKYTTVTNSAGDYMIFGVPTGNQQIHVDIDLSDIGILSQRPTDFTYKGYNLSMFDNPKQFKESTNLDGLAQIFSQNKSVFVYPFWGDSENWVAAITRSDVQIQYKFEPTCVFMGSIVSDNEAHSIGHKCAPDIDNGMNSQLIAGEGNIEMIRKTQDGLVEEYQVQTGESLIDKNGAWCYQIPMNLDFVGTDEYGNIVPTDDPKKGIPTRARVRFRVSKNETGDEGFSRHTAKYLVPMNPILDENIEVPTTKENGIEIEKMYNFGSSTPESCFRDLYWNNVYSVKNFIPKAQVAHRAYSKNYTALKGSNLVDNQNPVPFNKLRFDLPFVYIVLCIVFTIVVYVVELINRVICGLNVILGFFESLKKKCISIFGKKICPFKALFGFIPAPIGCISLGGGFSDAGECFYPGCKCKNGLERGSVPEGLESGCEKKESSGSKLRDRMQQSLAEEFKIVKLDFYQDWINGCLYMPLWYWRKRKKKTFLGITLSRAKNQFCSCDSIYKRMKTSLTCVIKYKNNSFSINKKDLPDGEKKWHKKGNRIWFNRGLIKQVENKDGLEVYYYSAIQAITSDDDKAKRDAIKDKKKKMAERTEPFAAVRLYATDIILLGNLNEYNMYGIPQMFAALPSTTANIPPIATISEPNSDNEDEEVTESTNEAASTEDSGSTVTTGMDWGNNKSAKNDKPKYSRGLFMDLTCYEVNTKAKSCINVERLSEFGVNLDMNYDVNYMSNGTISVGTLLPDGFISKYELDDLENRAIFATLNHIGFVPQTYQDMHGEYTTQIKDERTGYFIPKFKYIYPVDFDGRLDTIMKDYKNKFILPQDDWVDEAYLTFRMGAESAGNQGRKRHFYLKDSGYMTMPLYNNSFYFYFGINKGNTAIDKFNKEFYSQCFKNTKNYFSLDIAKRGVSYCPDKYTDKTKAFGYISVSSDDIQIPYTYKLTGPDGSVVAEESNMSSENFVIGGFKENGVVGSCTDGKIHSQFDTNGIQLPNSCNGASLNKELENKTYTLQIIDGNGKSITNKVTLEMDKISMDYEVFPLGTKFYNSGSTEMCHICNKNTDFYGKIIIKKIIIDNYECDITAANCVNCSEYPDYTDNELVVKATASSEVITPNDVTIKFKAIDHDKTYEGMCKCLEERGVQEFNFDANLKQIELYIYQPTMFSVSIKQDCSPINITNMVITVDNGDNFNTYLNGMPIRFMLGTNEDNVYMTSANSTNFYSSSVVSGPTAFDDTNPNSRKISGWFGVHNEDTYTFSAKSNTTIEENEAIWDDFVLYDKSIKDASSKLQILKYKFDSLFSLSNVVYVTEGSAEEFEFGHSGGAGRILSRVVAPYYADLAKLLTRTYLYQDSDTVAFDKSYPNIVGKNYVGASKSPQFNPNYDGVNIGLVGNYFAAFTNNGGYSSNTAIDETKAIAKLPNYSVVSVAASNDNLNGLKTLGVDVTGPIGIFSKAHTSGRTADNKIYHPHLRALNVDRRVDFDFIVLGPAVGTTFDLYDSSNANERWKENVWRSARISGITYNGIEMAYDNEYNLISANTFNDDEGVLLRVTPNNKLEYSYSGITTASTEDGVYEYVDENAATIFNKKPEILRRPYSVKINDVIDVTSYLWSTFNSGFTSAFTVNEISKSIPYYFSGNSLSADGVYNGAFDKNNYPTKRLLDVGNIPALPSYEFEYTSCSYISESEIDDTNNNIIMKASAGDIGGFTIDFEQPIQFVAPNAENNSYGNAVYKFNGSKFTSNELNMQLKYKEKSATDDFEIYTSLPTIIKVLPYPSGVQLDGISYIKSSHTRKTPNGCGGNRSIDTAISNVSIGGSWNINKPDGVSYDNAKGYFVSNNVGLPSDDNDFENITLTRNKVTLNETKVFTLMVRRVYQNIGGDFLTKRIIAYEFSDLYDIRDITLTPYEEGCYLEYKPLASSTPSGDGGDPAEGTTSTYVQTLTFDLDFSENGSCQVFKNYQMIAFSFNFKDSLGRTYDIPCSDVTPVEGSDEKIIRLKITGVEGMGYIAEARWQTSGMGILSSAITTLFAKLPSGFTYKLPFHLMATQGALPGENEAQPTNVSIQTV